MHCKGVLISPILVNPVRPKLHTLNLKIQSVRPLPAYDPAHVAKVAHKLVESGLNLLIVLSVDYDLQLF